jgi:hypothetical protein
MFKHLTSLAALAALITPALAMGASATEVDANGDGLLTIEEVQAVYPDVSAETFSAMDADADGALNDEEVKAAQDAGMMAMPSDG